MSLLQAGARAALAVALLLFAKEAIEYAHGLTDKAFDVRTLRGIALSSFIALGCQLFCKRA